MAAGRKQMRGMGVSQVLEANARQPIAAGKKANPFLSRLCGRNGEASACVTTKSSFERRLSQAALARSRPNGAAYVA